jgi:hypothetical protein
MKFADYNKRLQDGEQFDSIELYDKLEEFRSKQPVVYNIETTNFM